MPRTADGHVIFQKHYMKKIINQIQQDATVVCQTVHGKEHWKMVAEYGRFLAKHEKVDEHILILFAYFHDCMRHSDGTDPEHGPRAADYVMSFTPEQLGVSGKDQERLALACRHHTYECATNDLTIKACWDADRLDIGRVGVMIDPKKLFTRTAKKLAAGGN